MLKQKTRVLARRDPHYATGSHLVVEQRDTGSAFGPNQTVTLAIRRVNPGGERGDHVQIEIEIATRHEKRTVKASASFCAPAEIADLMAKAMTTPIEQVLA